MKSTRTRAGLALGLVIAIGLTAAPQMASAAAWTRLPDYQRWTGFNALERGQGVATDGTYYYYNGPYSMVKATISNDHEVASSAAAIPSQLSSQFKVDHIGDIDYTGGLVVAPLEDGKAGYQHPLLALYDANTLGYTGRYVQLPLATMPGGVPWVSVDEAAGLVYTAPWNQDVAQGTNQIVAYSLNDLLTLPAGSTIPVVKTITLSRALSRIQGATMLRGKLYASVDIKGDKSVYSIDLTSGAVTWEFNQDVEPGDEVQGITAIDRGGNDFQLDVLNVGSGWKSIFMYLQHYKLN
ncbi:hypothetical protein ACL9RL_14715 [Plantibacter sp. Mn2098]|uniref:hypothetical protein n=1 Tax=Plantibacter sp. Mn2098 TaxID=3395266 RepID=UPI003BE17077